MDLQRWREQANKKARCSKLEEDIDHLRRVFDSHILWSERTNNLGVSILLRLDRKTDQIFFNWLTETKYDAYFGVNRGGIRMLRKWDLANDIANEFVYVTFFPKGVTYQELQENCGYVPFDPDI
jgi:hypothetical protein